MYYLEQQKDRIIDLYNDNKSLRKVAKIINCSYSGVKRILKKYNIKRRNKCESLFLCPQNFSLEEKNIIIGTVLGDGHLVKNKKKGESCLYLGHSIKQREYIEWKHSQLNRWIGCKTYSLKHKIGNKTYETLNFVTRRNKKFTELRNIFYRNNKKIFPVDFVRNNINEFSLAVYYMDDGYNYLNKGCEFCCESFSKEENEEFIKILDNNFGINCQLRTIRKKEYRIYIKKSEKMKFFNIIKKYIIPSMSYKIKF